MIHCCIPQKSSINTEILFLHECTAWAGVFLLVSPPPSGACPESVPMLGRVVSDVSDWVCPAATSGCGYLQFALCILKHLITIIDGKVCDDCFIPPPIGTSSVQQCGGFLGPARAADCSAHLALVPTVSYSE